MIWNDRLIRLWASTGGVTPYAGGCVNPASLDLRLGNTIRRPHPIWERLSTVDIDRKIEDGTIEQLPKWGDPVEFEIDWLKHHEFVLLHSLEFVRIPPEAASILVLKSSRGRDGMNHSHSGWGDPGFGYPRGGIGMEVSAENSAIGHSALIGSTHGSGAQWTFEIYNLAKWPVKLVAGSKAIQMIMMDMKEAPELDYRDTGHYVYQAGPTVAHEVAA